MVRIWYRYGEQKPEVVDTCAKRDVGYILHNYMMAFGVYPGQTNARTAKVWAGRKCDEPEATKNRR